MPTPNTLSGFITRANLPIPQPDLPILIDPNWSIMGDNSEAADVSSKAGIAPAQSTTKYVWADSPYVSGKQCVLATPDNSTLDLRLIINGLGDFGFMEELVTPVIQAIRLQLSYQVSVTFESSFASWTSTWNCYAGDYLVAMNQLWMFGYLCPLYLTLPRDPIAVAGPV